MSKEIKLNKSSSSIIINSESQLARTKTLIENLNYLNWWLTLIK